MNRLLTKYGMAILSIAVVIAVLLSVMTYFSANSSVFNNIVGTVATPFRTVSTGISNPIEEWVQYFTDFDRLKQENAQLKQELAELEDAVYTYREFFRRKGIELQYDECEEEFPLVDGDPQRLRQVFCNLLDNADKHGGSGGRVDVSITDEPGCVAIRIRDYGRGVPEEELPFIKYKFYKGSSQARGSGIGMAVCEEIISCHGGTLDISNAEGGGCLVTLRLPKHGI